MIDMSALPGACRGGRWVTAAPIVPGAEALAEVKTYLRLESDDEDEALGRLIAVAIGHGEDFTGRIFLIRQIAETLPAATCWTRLERGPVRAITGFDGRDAGGATVAIPQENGAIDIDAAADGWFRLMPRANGVGRIEVRYEAGVAADWAGLPDPLRQGAVRLAAHLFTHRDAADEGAPPAAIAALWRPWRRLRLL